MCGCGWLPVIVRRRARGPVARHCGDYVQAGPCARAVRGVSRASGFSRSHAPQRGRALTIDYAGESSTGDLADNVVEVIVDVYFVDEYY